MSAETQLDLPMGVGTLSGSIAEVRPDTDDLDLFASWRGVRLERVDELGGGRVRVDTRRVLPAFDGRDGIVLNYPEAEVFFVEDDDIVAHYPCAVSRAGWKMPLGSSAVENMATDPVWYVPESIQEEMDDPIEQMPPGPDNPLGTRWIGFTRGLGFHGNNNPASIKQYASHGCVRLLEADVQDLYDRVSPGTPVHICYQPVKLGTAGDRVFLGVYPDQYDLYTDSTYRRAADTLLERGGLRDQVDEAAVAEALSTRQGLISEISA
jgi:L,D-transpeptidase ErfK/SrfK